MILKFHNNNNISYLQCHAVYPKLVLSTPWYSVELLARLLL